jgi:hypothetical protein
MPVPRKPALESAADAKEAESRRSALASRSLGAGAGCHEADAGDATDAACAEEAAEEEIEVTEAMIEAATRILNESGLVECPTMSNRATVKDMLAATFKQSPVRVRFLA